MNIQELHYAFALLSDYAGGNERRAFSESQVDFFLNKAQNMLINNYVELFETDYRRINELSTIHIKHPVQPAINLIVHPTIAINNKTINVYELPLSSTILPVHTTTRVWAITVDSNACTTKAFGRYIDEDDLDDALVNSFDLSRKSFLYNIGRSSTVVANKENVSLFIYSLHTLQNNQAFIEFLKKPNSVNLGGYLYLDGILTTTSECELSEKLHDKLVDLAVSIAYGTIGDDGYNIKKDILSNN